MRPCISKNDLSVPAINSSNNVYLLDVIGNKSDDESGDSLYSKAYLADKHIHSACYCYPTLAAGVTVTSSDVAWTLGNFQEIVPINTITSPFDIHWITIENISANGVYELHLFYGDTDIFAGSIRFTKTAVMDATLEYMLMSQLIPANSKIRAKLASSNAVADTSTISIAYHVY